MPTIPINYGGRVGTRTIVARIDLEIDTDPHTEAAHATIMAAIRAAHEPEGIELYGYAPDPPMPNTKTWEELKNE